MMNRYRFIEKDRQYTYKDFAKWVVSEIFDEMWEYNKGAFAEIACRKLAKLGLVRENGKMWEAVICDEGKECETCPDGYVTADEYTKYDMFIKEDEEQEVCADAISRAEMYAEIEDWVRLANYYHTDDDNDEIPIEELKERIKRLPSVKPVYSINEWCHDCKEYDKEKHCCPRFNHVIKTALDESKRKGHWITHEVNNDGVKERWFECSKCKWNSPVMIPNTIDYNFCPNCGVDMKGDTE